ncbi:MAG: hypothetical protein JXB29_07250, partial [Sedimentisphaerales bacterium]|nr:hypothetical protein [Sedimentisphaerales bacterium]
ILAGIAAFFATVLFNPFHLTNLTHTFVISLSEHAKMWRTVYEWHPAFEWDNPIGDEIPFLIMYIIGWVSLIGWVLTMIFARRLAGQRPTRKSLDSDWYRHPKFDIAIVVVASLTVYMAIRSRRFIPIAAMAACPLLALFIDQIVKTFCAARSFHKHNRFAVTVMSKSLKVFFVIFGAAAVTFFGTWWTLKFKMVYLSPWPNDPKLTSVFIRMTASHIKPFDACRFIRENKLKGKIFNYWTEGGFIAYGQKPGLNTGKTPLQLFMDGRAQAAYDTKTFNIWSYIMTGGPAAQNAKTRRRQLTTNDYIKIGGWTAMVLKKQNVWIALMPRGQFNSTFVKALETNPDWQLVFLNNKQKIFVDTTTDRGRQLFDGIFNGETIYPDQFSKNLIMGHNMFILGKTEAEKKQGMELLVKAFRSKPSPMPMDRILSCAESPQFIPYINGFCENYLDEFETKKKAYVKENGYYNRITAAMLASDYLHLIAGRQNDQEQARLYAAKKRDYENEQRKMFENTVW